MTRRDDYIAKVKLELDALNLKMKTFELKAKEAQDNAQEKYQEEVQKLSHQSKLASAKFEQLKTSTEDSWDAMTMEMEKVRDAFTRSFNYFKSQV